MNNKNNNDDEISKLFNLNRSPKQDEQERALEYWNRFQKTMSGAEDRVIKRKVIAHVTIALSYVCIFSLLLIGFSLVIDEWILAVWGLIQGLIALTSIGVLNVDTSKTTANKKEK